MKGDELKNIMQQDQKTWFTIGELAEKTNLKSSEIEKLIKKSDLFVQSSSQTTEGENLFSTRDEFREKGSLTNRILGAFKNRID